MILVSSVVDDNLLSIFSFIFVIELNDDRDSDSFFSCLSPANMTVIGRINTFVLSLLPISNWTKSYNI